MIIQETIHKYTGSEGYAREYVATSLKLLALFMIKVISKFL